MNKITWNNLQSLSSADYKCGHCGKDIASESGWSGVDKTHQHAKAVYIYICHRCTKPTFIDDNHRQIPGALFGDSVDDVPEASMVILYDEARKSIGVGAYTAAVLCCRKLLMNIAVYKGAEPGGSFIGYVKYLVDNHYVPPDASEWVDHIRKKGNEANHEITIMNDEDAKELVGFIEMLLKVIFEFPARIKKKTTPSTLAT